MKIRYPVFLFSIKSFISVDVPMFIGEMNHDTDSTRNSRSS